jgi:hypothetical protein
VFKALIADRDNACLMIGSTIVSAHQHAANGKGARDQALGRSRGGLTTKIHMLADKFGCSLRFIITAGQVCNTTQAPTLPDGQTGHAVLADKAYDSKALSETIVEIVAKAVIPSNGCRRIAVRHDAAA